MKSLKKILVVLLAVMFLALTFCMPAFAYAPSSESGCVSVRRDNFRTLAAQAIANAANDTIEALVFQAQCSRHPNIERLVRRTNAISSAALTAIAFLGVDAECVYETYIIGGEEVEIDPIIIIPRD